MANEAICIETPTEFRRYTIADATAVPIGTLMELTSPNTVASSSSADKPFAGIAWEEKTANDGIVELTVAVNGKWLIRGSAAINVGERLVLSGANTVKKVAAANLLYSNVGFAEETIAGAGELTVRVNAQ